MKTIAIGLILMVWTYFPFSKGETGEPAYTLIKKGSGMELSERWIKMGNGADSREIRMTLQVNTPIQRIIDVLKDADAGQEWNKNVLAYKVVEKEDESWLTYIRYDFPFPLSDRESYLVHRLVFEKSGEATIHFQSDPSDLFSDDKSVERMSPLEGRWVATTQKDMTLLSYHVISVPDESLPSWLADPFVRKNLWASFGKLREIIEAQK